MPLSRYNSAITEADLRTKPEGQYFERKGRETKPGKIANELIGMLNAGGGILAYGIVDELNEGVPRIFDAMREFMLAEPEYRDRENTVTLTLRNKVTEHKETIYGETLERVETHWPSLNQSQRTIIQLLFEHQEMDIAGFEKHMPLSGQTIRLNLKQLIQLEIAERLSDKIRDPNALYRFLNK